jgi:hypothetical protein
VLEAVLWILNTGAQWHMLPQSYPNYKTVHRRFQAWCCNEILQRVLTDVANELRDKGALDEEECFIDATFVMAKGGGSEIGTTKRGKGMKIMAIVDRHGLPLSVSTHRRTITKSAWRDAENASVFHELTYRSCGAENIGGLGFYPCGTRARLAVNDGGALLEGAP